MVDVCGVGQGDEDVHVQSEVTGRLHRNEETVPVTPAGPELVGE